MATSSTARVADIDLPDFGRPSSTPEVPPAVYTARLERLRERMADRNYDRLIVYADREHSANLAYLTGFDPRFEEAILVVRGTGDPAILVGNECYGLADAAPLKLRRHLFQDMSLPGQPRDKSRTLAEILGDEGVAGARVGVVGWKTYADRSILEVPSFLADELRGLAGSANVENAGDLLIDPADGLRVINEVEQLAAMEAAACATSSGVHNVLTGIRPGMRERDAVALLGWDGTPLSCHLMLSAGPRAALGLLSPGDRAIERGDPFTVAFGIWGALNCRAGFVVEDAAELPDGIRDYVDRLVGPYFSAVAEWYGALRIGATGGALHAIIDRHLGDPFFGIFLNPGHQIGLDEWVNSPIRPGSTIELRSGMAFQVDIIPATGTPYFTTNIEDGLALADASLRTTFASAYPEAWSRIQARRTFMADCPRDRAARGRPAVLEHPRIPPAVPVAARSGDDPRRVSASPDRSSAGTSGGEMLELRAGDAVLRIDPDVGGRIASLVVDGNEMLVTEGYGPIEWGCYPMAPFAGRIRDGRFAFRGRSYELARNMPPNAIHGTVFDRAWDVATHDPDRATLAIDLGAGWPFAGRARQSFALTPDGLEASLVVEADEPMPAWLGWHPWFRRSLSGTATDPRPPTPGVVIDVAAGADVRARLRRAADRGPRRAPPGAVGRRVRRSRPAAPRDVAGRPDARDRLDGRRLGRVRRATRQGLCRAADRAARRGQPPGRSRPHRRARTAGLDRDDVALVAPRTSRPPRAVSGPRRAAARPARRRRSRGSCRRACSRTSPGRR